MNDRSAIPACPQNPGQGNERSKRSRITPRFIILGAAKALFWMMRQVALAFAYTSFLFGAIFALFVFGSGLPLLGRQFVFHPEVDLFWSVSYVAIMALCLFILVMRAVSLWMERLCERYPTLEKVGWIMLLVVGLLFVGFVYSTWNTKSAKATPPSPVVFQPITPKDRVLLHLVVPSARARVVTPKGTIPSWTHINIVGTAQVKNLGHGRYEIRMLKETR